MKPHQAVSDVSAQELINMIGVEFLRDTPPVRPAPTIPEDRSSLLAFLTEGLRNASHIFPIDDEKYIVIYPPIKNSPVASTIPAWVIFGNNRILHVATRGGHRDTINGVLVSQDKKQFYTFADDGFIIGYSTSTYEELFQLNNDFRPVRNARFTTGNGIITNLGEIDSIVFNLTTKARMSGITVSILETQTAG